jgi:hypothetical protein
MKELRGPDRVIILVVGPRMARARDPRNGEMTMTWNHLIENEGVTVGATFRQGGFDILRVNADGTTTLLNHIPSEKGASRKALRNCWDRARRLAQKETI